MAIRTDMTDQVFFGGADWPNIPMQDEDNTNRTGHTLEFRVYHPKTRALLFTATIAGGGVVVTGTGTAITTGLFYVKILAAVSALCVPDAVREPTQFLWSLWRTDAGSVNELANGKIPVRM